MLQLSGSQTSLVATHSPRIFNFATHWCKCKIFRSEILFFFVTTTITLLFLDFMHFTVCYTMVSYTLQSLLGIPSDGVEYSNFKYEYRVLALRIFEYEYWWLTSSTSTGMGRQLFTLFAVCFFVYLYQRKNIQPNA